VKGVEAAFDDMDDHKGVAWVMMVRTIEVVADMVARVEGDTAADADNRRSIRSGFVAVHDAS
jgi:hypothetical protein